MKPTYRTISQMINRGGHRTRSLFPKTDYHFQAGTELLDSTTMASANAVAADASSSFWKWSTAEVADASIRDSRAEAVMFALIIGVAVAGPLALLWITLANYWL